MQGIHRRIAEARKDYLHKIFMEISKNHATVATEDVRVSCMDKSGCGRVDNPGSNVASKSGPNKAILDQGRGKIGLMLLYELTERGGVPLFVDPKPTLLRMWACECGELEVGRALFSVWPAGCLLMLM